ncbi:MAG: hypothetical protein RLZZ400_811 [Actinomycetota bacterium]
MKRVIGVALIAGLVTTGLTACDPPMPPDVAAQIAEQSYTCIDGEAKVAFPTLLSDITPGLIDGLASACLDPVMTMVQADSAAGADVVIDAYPAPCSAAVTVPYAIEAADVTAYFADGYAIALSPKTISAIFAGSITDWSDAAIAAENPDLVLPAEPIVVRKSADELAFNALAKWFKHLGANLSSDGFTFTQGDQEFAPLQEGEIAIIPRSVGYFNATVPVGIIIASDPEIGNVIANADNLGIGSGATKMTAKNDGDDVSITLNFDAEAKPMPGFDTADNPYDAIYPVNLTMCSQATDLSRAVATFLLRLDNQGSLGASAFNPLSTDVRIVSLLAARKGLPEPQPTE